MNKIGAANKTSAIVWVAVTFGVIFVGLVVYALFFRPAAQTSLTGTQVVEGGAQGGAASGQAATIVTSNPIIDVSGKDKQQSGTAVGSSAKVSTNGGGFVTATLGTTTAVPGQVLDMLLTNNTQYHNAKVEGISVTPGTFPITVYFNKNATVTENLYTTTGLVLANGIGSQNQTDLGNGASYNLKDEMTAASLTSTQDMVCVIEIEAGTNASTTPSGATLSLDGVNIPVKSTAKPTWYSTLGTNSNVYLFDVPALETSATRTFYVGLNAKSTGRFSAVTRMVKSCYTKEYFEDPNTGKITYDVADSDGTVKSIAVYKYTVYFQ